MDWKLSENFRISLKGSCYGTNVFNPTLIILRQYLAVNEARSAWECGWRRLWLRRKAFAVSDSYRQLPVSQHTQVAAWFWKIWTSHLYHNLRSCLESSWLWGVLLSCENNQTGEQLSLRQEDNIGLDGLTWTWDLNIRVKSRGGRLVERFCPQQ